MSLSLGFYIKVKNSSPWMKIVLNPAQATFTDALQKTLRFLSVSGPSAVLLSSFSAVHAEDPGAVTDEEVVFMHSFKK